MPVDLQPQDDLVGTLRPCVSALRLLADSEMPSLLTERMHQLGENKEFLNEAEQSEWSALVEFWRQRTLEKLEARAALERLREKIPILFGPP